MDKPPHVPLVGTANGRFEPKVPRFCIAANVCFICRAKPFNNYLGFAMGLWHKNFQ
jgi:hypothetical protein